MADLKKVYAAVDEQTALAELDSFDEKWGSKYPKMGKFINIFQISGSRQNADLHHKYDRGL